MRRRREGSSAATLGVVEIWWQPRQSSWCGRPRPPSNRASSHDSQGPRRPANQRARTPALRRGASPSPCAGRTCDFHRHDPRLPYGLGPAILRPSDVFEKVLIRRARDMGTKGMWAKLGFENRWAVAVLLALSSITPAQAKTWHVAPKSLSGIKADSQTRAIGEATRHLEPGDTIVVHGGVYREAVTIDRSGTAQQPITIGPAEGETVILTGADRLTDWSLLPGGERVYSTPWPHKFVAWNKSYTHPNDDYHRLIGRCEQVFVAGYPLRQVLERDKLSRGTFFADIDAQRLYVQPAGNQDITKDKAMVEASTREQILRSKAVTSSSKGFAFAMRPTTPSKAPSSSQAIMTRSRIVFSSTPTPVARHSRARTSSSATASSSTTANSASAPAAPTVCG